MLETANYNSWGNAHLSSKSPNCFLTKILITNKSVIFLRGDQEILRKLISFLFFFLSAPFLNVFVLRFNKHISLPMSNDVTSLMEKSKPEMVIALAPETQLDDGFGRLQPACGTINMCAWEFGNENDGNACFRRKFFHLWFKDFWRFKRE